MTHMGTITRLYPQEWAPEIRSVLYQQGRKGRVRPPSRERMNAIYADTLRFDAGEWGTPELPADEWPEWALLLFSRYGWSPAESVAAAKEWLLHAYFAVQKSY